MNWTTEVPTKDGYYWRRHPRSRGYCDLVEVSGIELLSMGLVHPSGRNGAWVDLMGGRRGYPLSKIAQYPYLWFGPIEPPEVTHD